jgi:DNA-damage-inducible protein D
MKEKRNIKPSQPLADFMPTILLKAKDFATEITIYNAKNKQMKTENEFSHEHITNNKSVRKTLISRGITPEKVKPEEDVKKLEKKIKSDDTSSLTGKKKLAKK